MLDLYMRQVALMLAIAICNSETFSQRQEDEGNEGGNDDVVVQTQHLPRSTDRNAYENEEPRYDHHDYTDYP